MTRASARACSIALVALLALAGAPLPAGATGPVTGDSLVLDLPPELPMRLAAAGVGYPDEDTLGYATKAETSDLDREVWDTDPAMTVRVDMGELANKDLVSGAKGYALTLGLRRLTGTYYVGDPVLTSPFGLLTVYVNGVEVRTVRALREIPQDGDYYRVFDMESVDGDPWYVVRVPVNVVTEGANVVKVKVLDYRGRTWDGFRANLDYVQIELVAPPLLGVHGWTPDFDPFPAPGAAWQPTLASNMYAAAQEAFGQNPWAWAKEKGQVGGVGYWRYDKKQDFRVTADQLASVVPDYRADFGYSGKIWLTGHSMGGLLTRHYVDSKGGGAFVEKLAQSGSPNLGAWAADKYTWWHCRDYYSLDGGLTARLVHNTWLGYSRCSGWRDWWNPALGAYANTSGAWHDYLADFMLKPVPSNPPLREVNAAFGNGGVEFFTVLGRIGGSWASVASDGVTNITSGTLNGAIPFRTVHVSHESIPAEMDTARYYLRFFTELDLDSGRPQAAFLSTGAGAPAERDDYPLADDTTLHLAEQEFPNGVHERTVLVDGAPRAAFLVYVEKSAQPIEVTLRAPDGTLRTPSAPGENVAFRAYETDVHKFRQYEVDSPQPGEWTLRIRPLTTVGASGMRFFVSTLVDGGPTLHARAAAPQHKPGESATILATLVEGGAPLLGATVRADGFSTSADPISLTLADDGLSGDGAPNDGTYGARVTTDEWDGEFEFAVRASGTRANGDAFARVASATVVVRARPDVFVESIAAAPADAWGGDAVTLSATLGNEGERASYTSVVADFYEGDPALGGALVASGRVLDRIPVGGTRVVTVPWTAPGRAADLHVRLRVPDYDLDASDNARSAPLPFVPLPRTLATLAGEIGENGWYRERVTVTLAPHDGSAPGYAETQYRLNGGPWTTYAGPFDLGEGRRHLEYRSVAPDGRVEAIREASASVDSVAPVASLLAPEPARITLGPQAADDPLGVTAVAGLVTVRIAASDATSGVVRVDVTLDGETRGEATLDATSGDYLFEWDSTTAWMGNHVLGFVARDEAGHTTASERRVYVLVSRLAYVDKDGPEATIARLAPAEG